MILNKKNKAINIEDGLVVSDGTSYQLYISKSNSGETIDFTNNDKTYGLYPVSSSLVNSKEQLSRETIGARTAVNITGASTYSGDISWGGFTSSVPYIMSNLMRPKTVATNGCKATSLLFGKNHNIKLEGTRGESGFGRDFSVQYKGIGLEYNKPLPKNIEITNESIADHFIFSVLDNDATKTFVKSLDNLNIELANNNNIENETFNVYVYYKNTTQDRIQIKIKNKEVNPFERQVGLDTFVISETARKGEGRSAITITKAVSFGSYVELSYSGTLTNGVYSSTNMTAYVEEGKITVYMAEKVDRIETSESITIGDKYLKVSRTLNTVKNKPTKIMILESADAYSAGGETGTMVIEYLDDTYCFGYGAETLYKEFSGFINNVPNMTMLDLIKNNKAKLNLEQLADYGIVNGGEKYNLVGTIIVELYALDAEQEKESGRFVSLYEPDIQDAILNNLLCYDASTSGKDVDSHGFLYTDVELKNMNFNFANKALTEITTTATAGDEVGCDISNRNEIEVNKYEDRTSLMVQSTVAPTIVYINGVEAKYFKDATFSFEWTKEDTYNIEAEKFIRGNMKYNWTFGGNMALNDLSKMLLEDLDEGQKVSMVIETKRKLGDKMYKIFFVSTSITGSIQEPSIAVGELSLALSGATGDDYYVTDNRLSNFIIAVHDDELVG